MQRRNECAPTVEVKFNLLTKDALAAKNDYKNEGRINGFGSPFEIT